MGTTAALIAMGAATGLQAYGQYKSGRDQAAAAKYNADVAHYEGLAAQETAAGQERLKIAQAREIMARFNVEAGASGVEGGTFEDVAATNAYNAKLDQLAIRMGGTLARSKAAMQAQYLREMGRQYRAAGTMAALTTLLAGGAQAYETKTLLDRGGGPSTDTSALDPSSAAYIGSPRGPGYTGF